MEGIVTKSTGSWYNVKDGDLKFWKCRTVGKLRIKGLKTTNPIAVGDHVVFSQEDSDQGLITGIKPRTNYIIRKSVNLSKQTQIIAANIDQALLVISLKSPSTPLGFIDRFLATAEAYSIKAILVFNKIDLLDEEDIIEINKIESTYSNIGYKTLRTSALNQTGLDELSKLLKDKTTLLSGHSGVGKSTLVNSIEPGLQIKTKEVSEYHQKGQHTTTFAEMFELKKGGSIIDTPGIKGFGLVDMQKEEIQDYFPDIFALKGSCRFYNCLHVNEPGCAVKDAVENHKLAASRYKSYSNLIQGTEDENTYRTDNYN